MGWHHKVGWIFCFLLVALLRMAHIIYNPSHGSYAHFGTPIISAADTAMGAYCSSVNAIGRALLALMAVCVWMVQDLCPDTYFYWQFRAWFLYRHLRLNWDWWYTIIYAIYLNPPHRHKGKFNGYFWMLVRAELFDLKAQYKELKKARKRLDERNSFAQIYNGCWELLPAAWHFLLFMILNSIGLGYFITRILLYKIGWLELPIPRGKRPWRRKKKKKRLKVYHVHTSVACNIDKRLQDQSLSFDTDSSIVICDNSANVHVCFDKRMFIGELRRTDKHYVATIGGSKNVAQGMGTVRWRWRDDSGKVYAMEIKDVLYFPQSPVNILSGTCLADQFKDDDGTGIDTKRNRSRFYWDHNKYQRTIIHPASNLPELPVNEGFTFSGLYSRVFGRKVSLTKEHIAIVMLLCTSQMMVSSILQLI